MLSQEKYKTCVFINNAGLKSFYRNWKSFYKPKAVVVIIHGLNSHSGYYQQFALQLNENGFEVYAIDLRGRGHSDGERFYISDYKDIVADIDQLVTIVKTEDPALPIFLFGHSAGGVFASVYAVDHQARLRGLISASFAFQVPAPAFALGFIKFLSGFIPHKRLVKINNNHFSRNRMVVEAMNNDPLIANEKQPAKSMQQLLFASEYLKNKMPEMQLPLLIIHGTADRATKPSGSIYFMEHASSSDKQLKLYEGHYHDLLNDLENAIVIRDIIQWLNKRA